MIGRTHYEKMTFQDCPLYCTSKFLLKCLTVTAFICCLVALHIGLINCMLFFFSFFRSYLHNIDTDKVGHCPWQTLLESVKNSVAVRPLKVLWRTQINPPRLSHERLDWPTENNPFIENWYIHEMLG